MALESLQPFTHSTGPGVASIHYFVFGLFKRIYGAPTLAEPILEDSKSKKYSEEQIKRTKMAVCSWRAFQYSVSAAIGIYVLSKCDWVFNTELYFKGHPIGHDMTENEKMYYYSSYGMSLFNLLYLPIEPIRLKDFKMYAVHHLVTLFLIHASFIYGFHRIGTVIMLLHDISDPFMEIAKSCLYRGYETLANIFFVLFMITFIITRNYIYPVYVITAIFKYGFQDDGTPIPYGNVTMHYAFKACLIILEIMHIYWAYLIIKVAQRALSPKGIKDVREKDD